MELGEGVAWGLEKLMSSPGTHDHGSETSSFSITWTYVGNAHSKMYYLRSSGGGAQACVL